MSEFCQQQVTIALAHNGGLPKGTTVVVSMTAIADSA
jgi:hypothetical protein